MLLENGRRDPSGSPRLHVDTSDIRRERLAAEWGYLSDIWFLK